MRTTLNLADSLLREAKKRAADEHRPLTRMLEDALRGYLRGNRRPATGFRYRPVVVKGGPRPGVDLADRDSLYEIMEGRR